MEQHLGKNAINRPIVKDAEVVSISTRTLVSILDEYGAPNDIDFLSLDTEGSEFEVIRDFAFDKYSFKVIINEHNFVDENRMAVRGLLLSNGYSMHCELGHDDVYVRSDLAK